MIGQWTMEDVFGPLGHVTWWQGCNRTALLFLFGLALVRVFGRRVFGKWTALDIVVSVIVGSNFSRAMTGQADMIGTMASTTLLMALHWVLAHAAARWAWLSRLVEGTPLQLSRDGEPATSALRRSGISQVDLNEALRQSGVESVADTRQVVVEPSGKINVLKR